MEESARALAVPATLDVASDYNPDTDETLFLLVSINGREHGLIAELKLSQQSNRMSAQRGELERIGVDAPRSTSKTVFLDQIPGLSYVYDAPAQTLLLVVDAAALIPVEISAAPQRDLPQTQTGFGLILNYRATTNFGDNIFSDGFKPADAFAGLELRAYTPLGVLTNTGSVSTALNTSRKPDVRRYNTFFTVSSPSRLMTMTAGDFTTAGLAWTRPVRLGGLQIRRDFSLRNDVVTSPLLSYTGTAAVPSTIDVYVDNVRAYSGAIAAGPFNLTDVPMITSGGEAVFVLRDAGGNEQVATVPFFATQNLLPKGTLDYSFNLGLVRETYDNRYGDSTAGTASLRYGVSDRLTFEAHAETLDDLKVLGFGFGTTLFNRAEFTLAAGQSVNGAATGSFGFATLRTELAGVDVNFSTRRVFGDYQDLASMTAIESIGTSQGSIKSLDALSLTFPIFASDDSFAIRLINSERSDMTNTILSASYSRQLRGRAATVRVNAFKDVTGDGGHGVSISASIPLGASTYASAGLQRDRHGDVGAVTSLSRSADRTAGSFGYSINLAQNTRSLRTTYQTRYGRGGMALRDSGNGASASATFDGALVVAGGGLFAGNAVSDGFAVVNVGVPNVPVMLNNRAITQTGMSGRAMVSDLRSFRLNRISIDPEDVPLDANLVATAQDVVPARGAGVLVDFQGSADTSAIVVLRDTTGAFVESGATVRLQGGSDEFFVGYDGEVWITDLGAHNRITVVTASGLCAAEFSYAKTPGAQVYIDGVECL
jgi:outer membrane usher protein